MYMPPQFAEVRVDELHRIIQENSLGILVRRTSGGLEADHLPFLIGTDGDHGSLIAHVARANPVWREVRDGDEVLVVFRGVQGYISPNWYPSKHETHRLVPTWNYRVVHAHGRLTVHDEEAYVRGVVARLTRTHEAGEPRPWKMGDSAPEYIDGMLKAIVGIEVAITRLEGKAKLSQNKSVKDRENAAAMLESLGGEDNTRTAALMRATI